MNERSPDERMIKSSHVYSSMEMQFNRNVQRIDEISFIIKKSKLVLNEYYKIFSTYCEKIINKDQDTVPEQLKTTTKQAINGIEKYLKILSVIES